MIKTINKIGFFGGPILFIKPIRAIWKIF